LPLFCSHRLRKKKEGKGKKKKKKKKGEGPGEGDSLLYLFGFAEQGGEVKRERERGGLQFCHLPEQVGSTGLREGEKGKGGEERIGRKRLGLFSPFFSSLTKWD